MSTSETSWSKNVILGYKYMTLCNFSKAGKKCKPTGSLERIHSNMTSYNLFKHFEVRVEGIAIASFSMISAI